MKNTNKYKILVLSDLKKTSRTALKSTIGLAKMIDGDINFFHVKKPTDVVEKENQLSAMRTINEDYNATEKKIRDLIVPLSINYDININYRYAFGNVKNEISRHIEAINPDIIVIGKRKPKMISLFGDSITEYILNKYKGVVMIAADKNAIQPNEEISLGFLNNFEASLNLDFVNQLLSNTQQPLKSFKILNDTKNQDDMSVPKDKKMIEYVFEQSDNAINTISNYINKNDVNLFCVERVKKNVTTKTLDDLDVSLLVTK